MTGKFGLSPAGTYEIVLEANALVKERFCYAQSRSLQGIIDHPQSSPRRVADARRAVAGNTVGFSTPPETP